jgi:hypothetical protein
MTQGSPAPSLGSTSRADDQLAAEVIRVSAAVVPPGWPADVRPPGTHDWERTATAWLFDLCPPDYRAHEVLRRHPVVLARVAHHHVQGAIGAARTGLSTARRDLADVADATTVEATVAMYEREGARLMAVARSLALVEQALRGKRFIQRI